MRPSPRPRAFFFKVNSRSGGFVIFATLLCSFGLAAFAALAAPSPAPPQSAEKTQTRPAADAGLSHMTSDQLATYVFDHHGCKTCHTMGKDGKLGFTDQGKQVGKNFEGCISLLTSMNVIAQTKSADRTAQEKQKAARFQQFGCTTCHQITPGKLGLTTYGKKLKSLHMACTDVEKVLSSK